MEFKNLRDLLVHELKAIYSAEDQILESIPKLAEFASNTKLKDAFFNHMKQTETQISRLEEIFRIIKVEPELIECKGVRGLIEETEDLLSHPGYSEVMDAALIAAAQRIEHYEVAAYGSARTYARLLGEVKIADLLQKTLDEEKHTDKLLNDLAEGMINQRARKR